MSSRSRCRLERRSRSRALTKVAISTLLASSLPTGTAEHHFNKPPLHIALPRDSNRPIRVTNHCPENMWPAFLTQHGVGPSSSGFLLRPGESNTQDVSGDWQGRVWARTNCTFGSGGSPSSGNGGAACRTGDCGNFLECQGAGQPPATLAEFTLSSATSQTFYDVSLVDGYNVPMGIISLLAESGNTNLTDIPPNLTNPVCIGTSALLAPVGATDDLTFGSNNTYPLPLEQSVSSEYVQNWCPWPLQQQPPVKPGDGVYPYPDDQIQRPAFNPCFSACAKWNRPEYCCTGDHNQPSTCSPSLYSQQAKKVCPDAYSYAYDDLTSTFIIPEGGGFEVVLCPAGRSTNILATFGEQMQQISQTGHVSRDIQDIAQNTTYIAERNDAGALTKTSPSFAALVIVLICLCLGQFEL